MNTHNNRHSSPLAAAPCPSRCRRGLLLAAVALLAACLALPSCDKMPDNGALDGMWQLMEIERGGTVENVKATQTYWSIRTNLVQLSSLTAQRYYAHFTRQGSRLTLYDLSHNCSTVTEADNNEWITSDESSVLLHYGIEPEADTARPGRLTQTFTIDVLGGDEMLLSTPQYRLKFRKF